MNRLRPLTLLVPMYGAGLSLLAFGSTYRPQALGFLAASPGVLVLLVVTIISAREALDDYVSVRTWGLLVWGLIASAIAVRIFGWNTLYATKVIPLLILSMVWISPLLCLKYLEPQMLSVALMTGLLVTIIGFVTGDLFPTILPSSIRTVIFGGGYDVYLDSRPRAFMTETSQFAAILGRFAFLLFLVRDAHRRFDRRRLITAIVVIAVALLATQSKGAAISVSCSLLALAMNRRFIPYLLLLLPIVWWIATIQIAQVSFDIENFTSTSTRTALWLAGTLATLMNPLGWGYFGFYGTMERFGASAMDALAGLPFLFTELEEIVTNLTSVSYKSTLLDFSVMFGVPFWILLTLVIRRTHLADPRVQCALVYLGISALSTASHESITFFLGMAILYRYYRHPALTNPPLPPHGTMVTTPLRGIVI